MRWGFVLAALAALCACIPHAEERRPPRPPSLEQASVATRQCRSQLAQEDVRFRALEDRRFEGGCSAIGAVQLLDIGTPVSNLGAMTCPLAKAFERWVRGSVQPASMRWFGVPVRRVETFGTYACRGINGDPSARLSEHAFANAVDVSAFELADGRRVTVQYGWNGDDERVRGFLREIHRAGCRQFNVGLSPDANAYHYNHMHFDMGRGPYCR